MYLCNLKALNRVKIKEVIAALERFAPLPLQEDWDNAGLQIGVTEAEVSGALLCLDVTESIVDEAINKGLNLIVSHHPLLFRGLKQVTDRTFVQRCVMKAIKNDIVIVSMHTNLDAARGGVNDEMAKRLGLNNIRFTSPMEKSGVECSIGSIGELTTPMPAQDFIRLVKETFHADVVMTNELLQRPIRTVAVGGGACGGMVDQAVRAGADAFVTGEMHYHEYFGHEQDVQIAVIGHYESEQFTSNVLKDIIEKACPGVRCVITEQNTNAIHYWQ